MIVIEQTGQRAMSRDAAAQRYPRRAIVSQRDVFIRDPGYPAFDRYVEQPRPIDEGGNVVGVTRPGSGRTGRDEIAVTFSGRWRRRRQIAVEHGQLDDIIERPQGLVVSDVLLALGSQNVGELQVGRLIHSTLILCRLASSKVIITRPQPTGITSPQRSRALTVKCRPCSRKPNVCCRYRRVRR